MSTFVVMKIYNTILADFKENVISQFIGVITFGFGVTAFYGTLYHFIVSNNLSLNTKDFIFILCSLIGNMLSYYILKNKISLKDKILKSIDFIITVLGFVLMFVPFIIFFEQTITHESSFQSMIITNGIYSLIVSIGIFLIKSVLKILIKHK